MDVDPNKQYQILVTADSNDADYMTETSYLSGEKLIALLPLIERVKENNGKWNTIPHWYPSNWNNDPSPEEMYSISEDEAEALSMLLPDYEDWGFHTIDCIEFREWIEFPLIKLL